MLQQHCCLNWVHSLLRLPYSLLTCNNGGVQQFPACCCRCRALMKAHERKKYEAATGKLGQPLQKGNGDTGVA